MIDKDKLDAVLPELFTHFKECSPYEMCGIIIVFKGKYRYLKCTNISDKPINNFIISPEEFASAEDLGEVVCVVHSHITAGANPSQADLVAIENLQIPYLIVSGEVYSYTEPTGYSPPLYGRQFSSGILDCYTFVKDYYKEMLNIDLIYHPREPDWWKKGQNVILDNYINIGFEKVVEPARHDVVLMNINSTDVPNHLGVLVESNVIGHHLTNRLSSRDVFNEYYRRNTFGFYRHRSML